jgi:sulfate transport system permease protein
MATDVLRLPGTPGATQAAVQDWRARAHQRLSDSGRARGAAARWRIGRSLLIAAVLGWFGVLILVPGLALLRQVVSGGLRPFLETPRQPEVVRAFGMSFGITVLATLVNTVFGIAMALVLVRQRFWGRALLDGFVDLPFAVSPVVAGLMLIVLYGPQGLLGKPLEAGGIHVVYAVPGMILATLFVTVPFVVRELVPVLRELGDEHEQAAYTLGAGRWRTFWSVTLPSIRWGVAYGVTLTVARSLGEFGAVLVVSGNLIGQTQTATTYVHDGIESFHPEGAYAASLVLAAVSFVLLVGMDMIRKHLDIHEERRPA